MNNREENKELEEYVEEIYGPYFVESCIGSFLSSSGTSYPILAHLTEHKLNLADIKIEKSEKMSNRYIFVATVGYWKDGEEEKMADVSGEVIFSTKEEGKIGRFQYTGDGGLGKLMNQQD